MTERQARKLGLHPVYAPKVNPLPAIKPVRGYVKPSTGTFVPPHLRKPPFRHITGYKP